MIWIAPFIACLIGGLIVVTPFAVASLFAASCDRDPETGERA